LTKELQTFELNPTFQPETPLGATDIEGYLAHHHEMVLLTAIEEANQRTVEATHRRMNQSIIDQFQIAKQKFLEELGAVVSPSQIGAQNYPRIPEVDPNQKKKHQLFGTRDLFNTKTLDEYDLNSSSMMPTAASLQKQMAHHQMKIESTMTEEMKLYAKVIEELNANRVPHTRNQFDLLGAFKRIASEKNVATSSNGISGSGSSSSSSNSSSSSSGSKWEFVFKCWQLLSSMIQSGTHSTRHFAERSLDLTQMDASEKHFFLLVLFLVLVFF
jgi:hypothetical protein